MISILIVYKSIIKISIIGSRVVGGKRFHESNASSIPGIYFRLGFVTLRFLESRKHSIRETFSPSTALDPYYL